MRVISKILYLISFILISVISISAQQVDFSLFFYINGNNAVSSIENKVVATIKIDMQLIDIAYNSYLSELDNEFHGSVIDVIIDNEKLKMTSDGILIKNGKLFKAPTKLFEEIRFYFKRLYDYSNILGYPVETDASQLLEELIK